ncbi:MAG: response regulator, partial [Chloroflexi bacterium]
MIRTLVVDDDYRVADLHCAYVERVAGFEVAGRVHTGAAALTGVAQLRPDLVLLDIYLPDMTGLEVLQRLREDETAPVDVIAITAAREVESLRAAMRGGVVHYLIKPFLFPTFEEKLLSYAAARERMARLGRADQGDVDRIFGALRTATAVTLPKGLSDATLELILQALGRSSSGLPAAAV